MKRLWMRLGAVAGILGVGGAGVLVAQKGGTTPEKAESVAVAPEVPGDNDGQPQPIPIGQGATETSESPDTTYAGTNTATGYSNELEKSPASSARFVEAPSSPQYSSSPASYSINDSGDDVPPPSNEYVQQIPESPNAPTAGYNSEYSEAPPAESGYAGRYGDPVGDSDGSGASLQSPQELTETAPESRYGDLGESAYVNEPPSDAAPVVESAPEVVDNNPYPSSAETPPTYQDSTPVATNEATIEPPPLSRLEVPDASSYAPVDSAPAVAQPQLLPREPVGSSSPGSSYSANGPSSSGAALVPSPLASDTPGTRDLEGTQTPTLTFEKRGPSEVSVGQAAPFKIIVRNVGNVTAHGVVVTDRVPQGTKLVDASPDFSRTADDALMWQLGDLAPGDEALVSIELTSLVEGTIGSIANVTFNAQASVQTVSTKPLLVVKHTGPERVLIGEEVIFDIVLSNPGSGATTGIVIEEDVPQGLAHDAGDRLEYEVGTLRPKEEKQLQLKLRADKAGIVKNLLRVKADGGLEATDPTTLEVIAPDLQVAIGGPRTRYLERQVTYEVGVANPGTSTAYDIQLVTFLPKGLKYVSADNKGTYDPRRHAVYWSLSELPAQESGSVQLTALPIETGEQKLQVEGTANLDLSAKTEHTTNVQALTELAFSVQDVHDPIEVGSETMYEIRIVNNGNKVATNVQIAAAMPEQLTPIRGEGPTKVIVEGQQVFMEPLARIAPRDEVVYRIAARGTGAGDHVIAVQLASDEVPTPVTKQESTKVYADE